MPLSPRGLAVRRRLPMRPVAGRDPETAHPVHIEAALRAVRHPRLELALEVGLHLEELQAKHLRVNSDRMIASTCSLRLVDELVGLDGLLRDLVDGVLDDLSLSACHGLMLGSLHNADSSRWCQSSSRWPSGSWSRTNLPCHSASGPTLTADVSTPAS